MFAFVKKRSLSSLNNGMKLYYTMFNNATVMSRTTSKNN